MSSKPKQIRAISPATLTHDFCKALQIPGVYQELDEARGAALEHLGLGFLRHEMYPYPWIVPVASHLMADKPVEQLAIDLLMVPDTVYLVRDAVNTVGRGLFLAWSGDIQPLEGMPYKGLVNHFDVGGEMCKVTAIQLQSCLR